MRRVAMAVALCIMTGAGPIQAQRRPYREPNLAPPVAFVGGGLQVGRAVGEFANNVDVGIGFGGSFLYTPTPDGVLGLRVSGMFLIYGSQTNRYPLLPLITVDVTTTNSIVGLTVGPQLMFGRGGVRAYANGGVGFSYFATTSEVRGSNGNSPFASSTNYDDFTFASEGGGGLLVRISRTVSLDIGARYLNNGRVTYVTKDGIDVTVDPPIISPIDSEANLVMYHLGVMVGLRRPPPEPPR